MNTLVRFVRLLLAVLAVFAAVSASAQTPLIDQGRAALSHGDSDAAIAALEKAVAQDPQSADAHFYLAVTFEKMGLSQEARPHWRSYRQLAPQGEWIELAREFSE